MTFSLKKTYNFSTLAPTLLGDSYANMKVKGILTSENAIKYGDVVSRHETVKSVIKNLPDNVSDLTYILFESLNKENVIMPIEYIQTDSIEEVDAINLRIDIPNTTLDDMGILKTRLQELGYTNFSITII